MNYLTYIVLIILGGLIFIAVVFALTKKKIQAEDTEPIKQEVSKPRKKKVLPSLEVKEEDLLKDKPVDNLTEGAIVIDESETKVDEEETSTKEN